MDEPPEKNEKLRVLVLTSSTGGGHDARARAFQAWVEERYPDRVDVRVEKLLEKASPVTNFGVWVYNTIQRFAPVLHNIYWWIVEGFGALNDYFHMFGHRYYRRVLEEFRPQVVFSVHDSINRGYFQIAKRHLAPDVVYCMTYCGEFEGGFGYSRNWVARFVDVFYSRTGPAQEHALRLGLPPERARHLCNFFPPEVFHEAMDEAGRETFRRDVLGLEPGKFTILLAAGGAGANNHIRFLEALAPLADKVQAMAICGRNRRAFESIKAWRLHHPDFRLYLEGYSDQVHRLMQVCDAVVTRGGTNTSAEAQFFGRPIIFNSLGGLMPQERLTLKYFLERGAAVHVENIAGFERAIRDWVDFSEQYQETRENMAALKCDDHSLVIVDEIIALAEKARDAK